MASFRLTPDAIDDLDAIWSFISQDNPDAADAVEAEIKAACSFLAGGPLIGHVRRDLTKLPVRFLDPSEVPQLHDRLSARQPTAPNHSRPARPAQPEAHSWPTQTIGTLPNEVAMPVPPTGHRHPTCGHHPRRRRNAPNHLQTLASGVRQNLRYGTHARRTLRFARRRLHRAPLITRMASGGSGVGA